MLGMAVGLFAAAEFYIPAHEVRIIQEHLLQWGLILAAAAFVLGGVNILQVNYPKIRRREEDWGFKLVLLGGAAVMGLVGIRWHTIGEDPTNGTIAVIEHATESGALIRLDSTRADTLAKIDGKRPIDLGAPGHVTEVSVAPGHHTVKVYMNVAGYGDLAEEVDVPAGGVAAVHGDLALHWGPSGRVYTWIYDYIFAPCNATMFALLAFFIASAAFRAFRARNTESALLLGAAILVMIGAVPFGRAISDFFPQLSDWIVAVPNNAGRRAIIMGAALGAIATSLRVILGLERSHLGSD